MPVVLSIITFTTIVLRVCDPPHKDPTADSPGGWGLVRLSNRAPLLRCTYGYVCCPHYYRTHDRWMLGAGALGSQFPILILYSSTENHIHFHGIRDPSSSVQHDQCSETSFWGSPWLNCWIHFLVSIILSISVSKDKYLSCVSIKFRFVTHNWLLM